MPKIYKRPDKRYPKNWNRLRHAIFKDCGYRCQLCNEYAKGDLHLHHILPIHKGGSHARYNLMPLCSKCHYIVHFENNGELI